MNIRKTVNSATFVLNEVYDNKFKNIIDTQNLIDKITSQMSDKMDDEQIIQLIGETCAYECVNHYAYGYLASIVLVQELHKNTKECILEYFQELQKLNLIDDESFIQIIQKNLQEINQMINYKNDFTFDYFGYKTLTKSYLLRDSHGKTIERPQQLFFRTALQVYKDDFENLKKCYQMISNKEFIHATPTLFNSCTKKPQLSSCYLLDIKKDSIGGIYDTLKDCAMISKNAGGIGLSVTKIQCEKGDEQGSNGIVPMLQVFNSTSRYVNQGGKRKGSIAVFLEPYHGDIVSFLQMKLNTGSEETKARDLFYGLVIPSLFMERVQTNQKWSLFCPSDVKDLQNLYGEEFTKRYIQYENDQSIPKKVINAVELWNMMIISQIETGTPYMLYKDSVNMMSNQVNIGPVHQSNLCVAPETLLLTRDGYKKIKSLKDQKVNIWNGSQYTDVIVKQTNEGRPKVRLVKVTLTNKKSIWVTLYHTFKVLVDGQVKDIKTCELKQGMVLKKSDKVLQPGYFKTLQHFIQSYGVFDCQRQVLVIDVNELLFKETKKSILKDIMLISGLCSVEPAYKQGYLIYNQNQINLMILNGIDVLGARYSQKCLDSPYSNEDIIESIVDYKRDDNTYCFNEPLLHQGVFNGILTGQCMEIVQHTNPQESAVCTLGSISLPSCVSNGSFDFKKLIGISSMLTQNLNNVIDSNYYPTKESKYSSLKNRPIGIGVSGLADVFFMMNVPFQSDDAIELNKKIFECIYYGSLKMSNELSKKYGPYETYEGSPFSKQELQFDLFEKFTQKKVSLFLKEEFEELKKNIKEHGLRNSLLTALMPTASTSQIFGNNECFEPVSSNLYVRRVLSGSFICVNKYLIDKLIECNKWSIGNQQILIRDNGSVQNMDISDTLKDQFRTVWEIKQKHIIDMAFTRQPFIDQSQSMNIYIEKPTHKVMNAMHFYGFQKGLKTGMYYLRTKPSVNPIKVTMKEDQEQLEQPVVTTQKKQLANGPQVIIDEDGNEVEVCINCCA